MVEATGSMKPPVPRSWVEDYVTAPTRVHPDTIRAAIKRRGMLTRMATREHRISGGAQTRHDVNGARLILQVNQDAERRAADPLERALTHLRARGYVPVCLESSLEDMGDQRGYRVGRHRNMARKDVIALAERVGLKPLQPKE